MSVYNSFVGLDIGKFSFVVAVHGDKYTKEYDNDTNGIIQFQKDYNKILKDSLCILETTGGYEMNILLSLSADSISVHRANTRKVKNFIRSFGNYAKTDNLDAKALALYGYERCDGLELFKPQSKIALDLYALVGRRNDLKQILIAEKNRLKAPGSNIIKDTIVQMIDILSTQMESITKEINTLIDSDTSLKAKKLTLQQILGIGSIVSCELLSLLPELGSLSRRQIASLAGVAPISNDSGKYSGYRRTGHGRCNIKPALFIAAMAARNSKSELKVFYEKLISNGKKKMVAITALMRKIIVTANAKLRDLDRGVTAIKI